MPTETIITSKSFIVTSVWSAYGHRFMSTGDSEDPENPLSGSYESCLTCGAVYTLTPEPDDEDLTSEETVIQVHGEYRNTCGAEPEECTGRTDLRHGGAPCEDDNGRSCTEYDESENGECQHIAAVHGCNCNQCVG